MKLSRKSEKRLRIFACLAILNFAEVARAITDPRAFTTKPPIHREAGLPWYLNDGESTPPEEFSGVDPLLGTKHSGQKKSVNYMIEAAFGDSNSAKRFVGQPFEGSTTDDSRRYENVAIKNVNYGSKNSLYEGVPTNSKKPTMVKISAPFHSSEIDRVAKYDKQLGDVQCPSPGATGQFIYPLDCKFFVNCHQGRAFVQPCAPGTLFNPDTLECDFPNKVRCYGGENAHSGNSYQPNHHGNFQLHGAQLRQPSKPECPSGHSGLLPHPDTCTKFLQCANGFTYIMDCGPGTAFNPKISVCDWPYNVPGCSGDRSTQSSGQDNRGGNVHYGSSVAVHGNEQRPNQYENHGGSSGSGHGTYAWNGASQTDRAVQSNAGGQYDHSGSSDGPYNGHVNIHDHAQRPSQYENNGRSFDVRQGAYNRDGTAQPGGTIQQSKDGQYDRSGFTDSRYNGHVIVDGGEQRWPRYENAGESQTAGQWNNNGYVNGNGNDQRVRDQQSGHNQSNQWQWTSESEQTQNKESDKFNGESFHNHGQHVSGNGNGQGVRDQQSEHNQSNQWQWTSESEQTQNKESDEFTGESSHNHGQHVNFQNGHAHAGSGSWNNAGDHEHSKDDGREMTQVSSATDENRDDWSGYHHHRDHHHDGQHQHHQHHQHYPHGNDHHHGSDGWHEMEGTRPERPDPKYPTNDRTGYGRTNTDFSNPGQDDTFRPNGSPHVGWKPQIGITTPRPSHNEYYPSRHDWNRDTVPNYNNGEMRPSQSESTDSQSGVFAPSSWRGHSWTENGQHGSPPTSNVPSPDEWNQGSNNSPRDEKFDDWLSKTNVIHRGNSRKDQDNKMDDWSSKTNIFNSQQGNKHSGVKTSSRRPQNNASSGIYVNVNGTRGHYITKEIEVNQGHSNMKNYGQVTTNVPFYSSNSYNRSYVIPTPATLIPEKPTFSNKPEPARSNGTYKRWKPMRYKPINVTSDESKPTIYSKPNDHPNDPNKSYDKPLAKPFFTTESPSSSYDSITQRAWKRDPRIDTGIELPTVSIDQDYNDRKNFSKKNGKERETINFGEIVEPDVDNYEIEVFEKESWKPRLTFLNKTKKTNVESVIMGINNKNDNVEILDVKLGPSHEDELPFPVYYIAPVHPLGFVPKPTKMTPATGQILRLRGGSSPRDGYLEVQGIHPGWGIVCDSRNGWTINEAHVVCRQLGYTRGAEMAWQGRIQQEDADVSWIASTKVYCRGNETQFQTCEFVHGDECIVEKMAVGIRCMANRLANCRNDEISHDGQCYHLANPESGLNHAEALDYCSTRNAQLIDITSQAENNFLSEWLMKDHPYVNSIMTSGVGFTTFNRVLWLWEDSARAKFQFNKWWPGWTNDRKIPPSPGTRPVCVVMKKQFPCHNNPEANCTTDYFFWDIEDCATSMKGHSYVCERPHDDIGCVYGKGQLYAGNANVSTSGKKCLPWKDHTLIHALRVLVLNSEVRENLTTHNYCRNPNPMKESRPWCFVGEYGERDYCDIPPCGEIGTKRSPAGGKCKPKHFECMPGECIPSPWVCDGEEDCTNGIDEVACSSHLAFFKKIEEHRLAGHDVEKWLNTPAKTCSLRCKEADFTCRSFSHKSDGNVCLLSDANVGITGDLLLDVDYDYYEMKDRTINCDEMFECNNGKCVNRTSVCDGKNDCGDRSDENICTVEKLDYEIRLAGSNNTYEGRVEVKVIGHWGQVCDDGFGMIDANVVCKELGFDLGALEVSPGGYFGNMDPPERFMIDQLKCRGNETSIRECDFDGWGVHDCRPEEAVGVVCKSAVNTCQLGQWKCDTSPACIPTAFICDDVEDCPDKSDESAVHCKAPFELRLANGSNPLEGRVEIRHHGVWGTVCDDDFTHSAAKVICRSLGYGGEAAAKKNGFFGSGEGPIWLDEVFCHGNETQLYKCEHNPWGRHNCDHDEDAGVICAEGSINDSELDIDTRRIPEFNINELLPSDCGRRPEDFSNGDDGIFQRVVRGSIAPKGSYPWQASLRIRGHSRSSHWCGAVVLSPLHVLTAAHCLEGYNKGTYFIRAGDYHSEVDEGTEVEANIEDYYVHEDFGKGQRMNNDIALVLLKGHGIPLGEHVMPICLPPYNTEYSPGLNCTISGFGSVAMGQSAQSLNLRYGWIPLLNQSVCEADYVYGRDKISDGMICAGYLDEGADTCDGDSGGPLACQKNGAFTLYGLTSWGHHCGEPNKPGVYVRVAHYRDWIDRKIRESINGR